MLVSKMVPQIRKNASQMGSKAPNFDPKSVKMDQEWLQNGQDGPKWPFRGLKIDPGGSSQPSWIDSEANLDPICAEFATKLG